MGLSQLLAASRTVRNVRDQPARFKMTQQNLLPKFGARAEGSPAADDAGVVEKMELMPAPVQPVAKAPVVPEENVVARTEAGPAKAAAFVEATKKLRPFGSWSLFRNPFRKGETRKMVTAPAQSELSLDLVRPVRNDLSEVDFELGRMPQPAAPPAETRTEPIAVPAPAKRDAGLWQRVKTRLWGASDAN